MLSDNYSIILVPSNITDASANIQWQATDPTATYVMLYLPGEGWSKFGPSGQHTVKGLTPSKTYSINANDDKNHAREISFTTLPAIQSSGGNKMNITINSVSDTTAIISWSAPATGAYSVSITGRSAIVVPSANSITLTDLQPGTTYDVSVTDIAGSSGSASNSFTTSAPLPAGSQSSIVSSISNPVTLLGFTLPLWGWIGIAGGAYYLLFRRR